MNKHLFYLSAFSVLCASAAAQNNECTGALRLPLGLTAFDTTGATTSLPAWPCGIGGADIWYRFTAPNNANYTFDTCGGASYDTTLQIFSGTCGTLVSIACNDDFCGLQSSLTLGGAVQGTDYYLRVGGFASQTGTGTLTVNEFIPGPGDECSSAVALSVGVTNFDTTGATTSAPAWPCGAGGSDIWFRFTAPNSTSYRFDTCTGTFYDSTLEVFSGACNSLVSLACNDDFCGLQSQLVLSNAVQGTDYYLRVGGFGGGTGSGMLTVNELVPGTLLTNQDSCANASLDTIGAGLYDWDNSQATTGPEGQNEAICYAFGTSGIESDIWAVYDVGVNGSVTIESCGAIGSLTDTRIAAYPLAPCASIDGTSVACSDDDCGAGFLSSITFNVSCGQSYLVQLGAFPGGGTGSSQVRITETGGGCGPGPIGTTPANCNPAVTNSTGLPAEISAFGSVQISNMDVRLSATHVPAGQFGIFFTSQTLGFIPNPGGSLGNICVIGNQGRYNAIPQIYIGGGANVSVPVGGLQVGNVPVPVNPTIPAFTPGTWYFQGWFREVGMTNNFTNVVQITFVP